MRAPVLLQCKQADNRAPTWQLCGTQKAQRRVAFLDQRSWTAGTCSTPFLQQSNCQAARAISQEDAEACCLNKIPADRGRAVSKPLFSVQPVCHAQWCSGLASSEILARLWCHLTFEFDFGGRLLTADCIFDCVEESKAVVPCCQPALQSSTEHWGCILPRPVLQCIGVGSLHSCLNSKPSQESSN